MLVVQLEQGRRASAEDPDLDGKPVEEDAGGEVVGKLAAAVFIQR